LPYDSALSGSNRGQAQYLLRDLVAVVADQNGAEGDTNRISLLGP
jgi:hypothetical protein